MTDVIAVAGSARRGGNSDAVLDAALEVMRGRGASVQVIVPRRMAITPCSACGGCWDTGRCVVKDAMQELYPLFDQADHVVLASPIYFTSLPGHVKVMVDRCQCLWVRTYRLGQRRGARRRGMFLCVGAVAKRRYYDCTLTVVRTWMSVFGMTCAVDRFYGGVDEKDAVARKHPDYLEDARRATAELLDGAEGRASQCSDRREGEEDREPGCAR